MFTRKRLLVGAVGALVVAAVSTATLVNANASTEPAARKAPAAPANGGRIALTGNTAGLAGTCYLDTPDPTPTNPASPDPVNPNFTEIVSNVSVYCDPDVPVTFIALDASMVHALGLPNETPETKAINTAYVESNIARAPLQWGCIPGMWTTTASAVVTLIDGSTLSSGQRVSNTKYTTC